MSTKTNEFAKIGKLVDTIIKRYREVRMDCGIPDNGWHSRTIEWQHHLLRDILPWL